MAAMHWEARRRQNLLDRRMARDKQQVGLVLHPGRCHHLSFLKGYNGAEPTVISRWLLLYFIIEQNSEDWKLSRDTDTLAWGQSCFLWVARSLYPVADFQDLFKHKRWFRLDLLSMVALFSLLNQRYI